jgi:biopolymer transport protein ExbD
MTFKRHYNITKGEINLAPLIDMVFQLIIFFMLSSSFIMQPGIKIKLPKAETTETIKEREIFVDISENGTIFYNGKAVSLVKLKSIFEEEIKNNGNEIILVIKGDKDTKHGIVVSVMDLARKCGIERIAIATMPEF